jgi:glycosyltransferase involved in cell wall biosynthesis
VSVVVPFGHAPSADRVLRCISALINQRLIRRQQIEIILVNAEFDATWHGGFSFDQQVRVLRVLHPARRFPLSLARNIGARAASHSTLCFVDADMILDPEALTRALRHPRQLVTMWTRYSGEDSKAWWAAAHDPAVFRVEARRGTLSTKGYGGLVAIPREPFFAIGGYDEVYDAGWGSEDNDIVDRCVEHGLGWTNLSVTDGIFTFHQWHPTTSNGTDRSITENRAYYKEATTVVRNVGRPWGQAHIVAEVLA